MTLALAPGYESAKSYYDRPLVDLSGLPRLSQQPPLASCRDCAALAALSLSLSNSPGSASESRSLA